MTDLLGVGAQGVRAIQTALSIVGDNVANADTPGFVRRTVSFVTPVPGSDALFVRGGAAGVGVGIASVDRATDGLAMQAARTAAGDAARLTTRADWLGRLQTALGEGDLNARLGGFFDAATALASAPSSVAARGIFLDRAGQAADGFRETGAALAALSDDLDRAATGLAGEVNSLTAALSRVNDELRRTAPGGSGTNGLLDSRDRLLGDLADRVKITTIEGPRGAVEVKLGTGASAATLVPLSGNPVRIGVRDIGGGNTLVLDPTHAAIAVRLPASGSLAGMLEAARQTNTARAEIDGQASRFAAAVNASHARGTDALGDPGGALFATATLTTIAGKANAGTATVDTAIADAATLATGGYTVLRDPLGWTLARRDGSATVSGPGTLTLDGVTVTAGSGARDGDSWDLEPITGAAGLALRPIGPERLAVADRWLVDAGGANAGSGGIAIVLDPEAAGLPVLGTYAITIIAPGIADIVDPATGLTLATVPADGTAVQAAGFVFTIPANAVPGDSFRITAARAGSNDNGNIRVLAALRELSGPGGTFEGALDATVARAGTALAETRRLADSAIAVSADAAAASSAVSGVDLDREAAELTRLQTAYRANAQVMNTARALFDALLQAVQ